MDNLPPSDNNNSPNQPNGSPPVPPTFGTHFDPHSNPIDPNNPYQTQPPPPPNTPEHPDFPDSSKHATYSEVAQHKMRDTQGRFIHSEHTVPNQQGFPSQTPPTTSDPSSPSVPSNPSDIPKPESNFKKVVKFIVKIKWAKVTLYFVSFIGLLHLIISQPAVKNLIDKYFPNSSPVIAREVSLQGVLKSSQSGLYTLVLPDQQAYTLHFKPSVSLTNLKKVNEVMVKGHLSWKPFVIEEAELYPLNFTTDNSEPSPKISPTSQTSPNTPNIPNQDLIPKLYSDIKWEKTERKIILFTSGKRRIEEEGIYMESAQLTDFPQAFVDYYTNQLTSSGFKETLNSSESSGTTITYSKEDLFLTFGVKNIYSGSGENKKLVGYKAYLEHN